MAALASVGSAIVLLSLKSFLAASTGSLGVLSEALHSTLDLIAAIITYLSVRVSDRPADADHTYGHGKVENFSAFLETGLLILTAAYIIWEAVQRLFFRQITIRPSLLAIGILGIALGIDLLRSRTLARVAREHVSEALEADALHFSTDVWSTSVVILGVAMAWVGQRTGVSWLRYADPVAALGVAAVVIWVAARLGRRTADALLDTAPAGLQERVARAVEELEGVLRTERVRVRRAGNRHFVDVTVSIPRAVSFEQVHAISDEVERRVSEIIPADVMVHMEPRARAGEHLFDSIRAAAQRRGLAVHDLSAHQFDGHLFIEMHLEVEEHLTLREAHRQATDLEEEIRTLPSLAGTTGANGVLVNIHIEPMGAHIATVDRSSGNLHGLADDVEAFVNGLRGELQALKDCHDVRVQKVERRIQLSCHCAMDGNLPITVIHDVTARLEDRVKERFPQISRVTIHPEPLEAAES
ncbi:MAG TPA: cation-efflux pump [Rugosimonospora sp.]|nr:cation-efflux pump [Rugosimonospora sp.]